jgi:hypothetical protein
MKRRIDYEKMELGVALSKLKAASEEETDAKSGETVLGIAVLLVVLGTCCCGFVAMSRHHTIVKRRVQEAISKFKDSDSRNGGYEIQDSNGLLCNDDDGGEEGFNGEIEMSAVESEVEWGEVDGC